MKMIDLSSWDRAEHYNFFSRMDYPQYNICMNVDITNFLAAVKQKGLPFYYTLIYLVMSAANEVEEFRYRIHDHQVVLHDSIHPSFTELTADDKYFKIVTVDLEDSLEEFIKAAKLKAETQRDYFPIKDLGGRDDLIYITCIPWISFTHISHTMSFKQEDAVPRISWGKYFEECGKIKLPLSVQVHHALADGVHMVQYFNNLQEILDNPEKYLN
jgi:chloramphenicol O-acetyltransferase type A